MWNLLGTTRGDIGFNTPLTFSPDRIYISDFKATDKIPESDFINASKNWLSFTDYTRPESDSLLNYTQQMPTNLIQYNRFNIVHPVRDDNNPNVINYEYDGCYYTYIYQTAGTNKYYLNCFMQTNNSYSSLPTLPLSSGYEVTRDRVKACYLVGVADPSNEDTGIGPVRPLWLIDCDGLGVQFNTDKMRYLLGPIIPNSCIQEWLRGLEEIDEDKPDKPEQHPEEADQSEATTTDFTWLDNFRIVNWTGPWPSRFIIDKGWTDTFNLNDWWAWNSTNDSMGDYHGTFEPSYGWPAFNAQRDRIAGNINNLIELGSDVIYYENTGTDTGYFWTGYGINSHGGSRTGIYYATDNNNYTLELQDFDIKYNFSSIQYGGNLSGINLKFGTKSFSLFDSYANFSGTSADATYRNDVNDSWYSVNIIRYQGHYYLGGLFRRGSGYTKAVGFCILCRIDDLDKMPNYGGSNPGDPTNAGVSKSDLDNIFGKGTGTEPNPTTDSIINNSIGDGTGTTGSAGSGSAYDGDGNPVNPADSTGTGTGEKNTNPVDTGPGGVPNSHDGSMGNGTGNPHQNDKKIEDPVTVVPRTVRVKGTVTGSGILNVFTPTLTQLNNFTSELLSSTVLNSIRNFFSTNPMDGLFGLHMIPYTGFDGVTTASPRIGTHNFATALNMADTEFLNVDYGEVYVPFVYDGYENFAPQSDVKIFLPFIGMKDVDINVIQGCKCSLKYNVSLVTGDVYAYMYTTWASKWGRAEVSQGVEHLVYHWQGNCAATIPLSHLDSTNYISGAMQIAGGITSLAAGAATASPFTIPAGVAGVTQGVAEMGRTNIITSGNISGMAAFMGCREPYFLFSRPIIAYSNAYNHYLGMRSNAIQMIGQLRTGTFTKMRNVDLKGIPATADELNEIDSILKGGFYA